MKASFQNITDDILLLMEQIVFGLNKDNFNSSIESIMNLFDDNLVYSFNTVLSQLFLLSFSSNVNEFDICIHFLQEIEEKEKINKNDFKLIHIFTTILLCSDSQESNFLLEKLYEYKLITSQVIKSKKHKSFYFSHFLSNEEFEDFRLARYYHSRDFFDNIKELSKNNWELHKQLIKEGVNPNEIAKIIRNDEIEKLQEISSQNDFNFNQIICPSIYERCSFINQEKVSLIDYAAFFGSIKCFKFLLLNGASYNSGIFAVAGGNIEMFHLCEQYHLSFEGTIETAILFHRNDIFHYLYENKMSKIDNINKLGKICIKCNNYQILYFLEKEGMDIEESFINLAANIGNIFLVKYFLNKKPVPKDILIFSSLSGNVELVKYVIDLKCININEKVLILLM